VTPEPRRTALVVAPAEAQPRVAEARRRWAEPDRGIRPHITLLFPFVAAAEVDDETLAEVGRLYAATRPFAFTLRSVDCRADAVPLPEELPDGTWTTNRAFPLGEPA
jgi:hypothetical protein